MGSSLKWKPQNQTMSTKKTSKSPPKQYGKRANLDDSGNPKGAPVIVQKYFVQALEKNPELGYKSEGFFNESFILLYCAQDKMPAKRIEQGKNCFSRIKALRESNPVVFYKTYGGFLRSAPTHPEIRDNWPEYEESLADFLAVLPGEPELPPTEFGFVDIQSISESPAVSSRASSVYSRGRTVSFHLEEDEESAKDFGEESSAIDEREDEGETGWDFVGRLSLHAQSPPPAPPTLSRAEERSPVVFLPRHSSSTMSDRPRDDALTLHAGVNFGSPLDLNALKRRKFLTTMLLCFGLGLSNLFGSY